jgi:dTDP-4-amino-4,6-dideoxygalactose transaminase
MQNSAKPKAVGGGDSMSGTWPQFADDEIAAVIQVLQSGTVNYWTGSQGREFETDFADFIGTKHAIALHNGTVALELALHALEIGPGDEVITTPRTYVATASAIVMRGATPVFVDIDRDSQVITPQSIESAITRKTKAILVVHLAGWPCEMDTICDLANSYGLHVIEDCAQSLGAKYKNKTVGAFGKVNAFSFCQDKILTTGGEGGMLTCDDPRIWSTAWSYKDHGKSYDAVYNRVHPPGYRWIHESIGTNWRMLEVQAAIGKVALRKVVNWIDTRRGYAHALNDAFSNLKAVRITRPSDNELHSYYKYYCFIENGALKSSWSRDRIMSEVSARGVNCYSGSCSEVYLEKAFSSRNIGPKVRLPVAQELGETALMFLVHPTQTPGDIDRTIEIATEVISAATL